VDSVNTLVDLLIDEVAIPAHHEYERVPLDLVSRVISAGRRETGILGLFVGAANWGVSFPATFDHVPPDPAGADWNGPRRRSGKHLNDGGSLALHYDRPYGGLGIPHIDSSFLRRDTYAKWARPPGIPSSVLDKASFDQVLDRDQGKYREAWLEWSTPLLKNKEFHQWSVSIWLDKYWEPASKTFTRLKDVAINARIANSAKGIAKQLRDGEVCANTGDPGEGKMKWSSLNRLPTVDEQIDTYVQYKLAKRGQSSADRTLRQAKQALRVGVLVDVIGLVPLV